MQKVLAAKILQFPQFHNQSLGGKRFEACIALVFKANRMMVLTMKFKRNVACAGNFGVVISKLYYK